jgi:nucleotide-binding universal stress UspA family protein
MIALKKILVATDFNEPSVAALNYGRELARSFGAKLVVLHVVDDTLVGAVAPNGFVFPDASLQQTMEGEAQRRMDDLVSAEDRRLLGALGVVVTANSPAMAVVQYAKDSDVNLIVIGTHGRGAIAHLLLGSVAEHIVRIAPCPVLTVRHPEREFVIPDVPVAVTHAGPETVGY